MTQFMTVDEVAEELIVTRRWVLDRVRDNTLGAQKMGDKMIRIRKSELDRYLEATYVPAR